MGPEPPLRTPFFLASLTTADEVTICPISFSTQVNNTILLGEVLGDILLILVKNQSTQCLEQLAPFRPVLIVQSWWKIMALYYHVGKSKAMLICTTL